MRLPSLAELRAGFDGVLAAPRETGTLDLIVRRPEVDEREVVVEGALDVIEGLVGDNWKARGNPRTPDGSADARSQITVIGARLMALLAGAPSEWAPAGDQLYVDFDLSVANLPAGIRLAVGDAVIEVTDKPHRGCAKFAGRFGSDAMRFVNSELGRSHRLRGLNARVVEGGRIRTGDEVRKLP